MARTLHRRLAVHATSSEPEAFRHADFVIITISTGGLDMMAHDLAIPDKYGIFQTVGDTAGPGGWSRSLRNIPVFVHLARQIERYSPRAVVMNYTNPLAALTGAITAVSSLRVVGLCHGVFSNYEVLQRIFGVEEKDLCVRFGGVNHFFWVLDFTVKGQPGYPLLKKRLGARSFDQAMREGFTDLIGFRSYHELCTELYRQFGYLPYVGDRHTCEFLPGCISPKPSALRRYGLVRTTIAERRAGHKASRQFTLRLAAGKEAPPPRTRESAVDILMAFAHHRPFVDVGNLPNVVQIDNLSRGAVVETLALVDGLGFRPIAVGPLPAAVQRLVEPQCICQKMTLQAALTGDRELALHSLLLDPVCSHLAPSQIRAMGNELLAATSKWLPRALRAHG
jgi:alpha-galactosidase